MALMKSVRRSLKNFSDLRSGKSFKTLTPLASGLYYKHMTIINEDSIGISK
jgi:hypothetical protein